MVTRRPRLLLVGDAESPHVQRWASALSAEGNDVICASFTPPGVGAVPDVSLESLGDHALSRSRYLRAVPRLARLVHTVRPDVIHAHFVSSYGVMTWLAAARRPVIQFAWGSDVLRADSQARFQRHLVARVLRGAATVVYDAEVVGDRIARLAPGVPRILVWYGPEKAWTELPRREQQMIFSPRRPRAGYNVDTIIEAAADIVRPGTWRLEVATMGEDSTALVAQARALGVEHAVTFHGFVTRDELRDIVLSAAIFVSVPSYDATAASLLEGLGVGAFPVVSDLPAATYWVRDDENGLVVPARDVGALTAALSRAVGEPELRSRSGAVNRRRIAQEATFDVAVRVQAANARVT